MKKVKEHNNPSNTLECFILFVQILDDINTPEQNIIIVITGIRSYNFSENIVNNAANKIQETTPNNTGTNSLLMKKVVILKNNNYSPF